MVPGPVDVLACPRCGALQLHGTLASGNTFGARWWSDGKLEAPMLPVFSPVGRCTSCGGFFWLERAERVGELSTERPLLRAMLEEVGPRRVEVMALLRKLRDVSLQEAKALLTQLPLELGKSFFEGDLRELFHRPFEAVGAVVTTRVLSPVPVDERHWERLPHVERVKTEADLLAAIAAGVAQGGDEEHLLRLHAWWAGNDVFREPGARWVPLAERPEARDNLLAFVTGEPQDEPAYRLQRAEALRELERFEDAERLLAEPVPLEWESTAAQLRTLVARRDAALRELTPP